MPVVPALRTEQLTKRFGRVLALDSLDLEVAPGEVFGFLGPNGAGKSTTIRLLLGLARPSSGRAWVLGTPAADVAAAHAHLAHVPADVALWPSLTGAETLELLARIGPGTDPVRTGARPLRQVRATRRARRFDRRGDCHSNYPFAGPGAHHHGDTPAGTVTSVL